MTKTDRQKTVACGRCRGQKLRCTWEVKEPQCRRCQRANAICTIPKSRPMGRPPRDDRGASSYSNEHNEIAHCHSEGIINNKVASNEDTLMSSMTDSLDFLQWFPDPDGLSLLDYGGPASMAQSVSNSNSKDNGEQSSRPNDELLASAMGTAAGQMDLNHDEQDDDRYDPEGEQGYAKLLAQLCQLNVTLFQHPMHTNNGEVLPCMIAGTAGCRQSPGVTQSDNVASQDMSLSDLRIGNLLELTNELRKIVTRIRVLKSGTFQDAHGLERSTALVVLSCYTRLDILYSRTLEILVKGCNGGQTLKDVHLLMPGLTIDGFSLSGCHDLQLSFLVHLFEKAHARIRTCIGSCSQALLSK
ncbi:hypothetical protein JX265_011211 [Neoarthrinium moseri]|uniref:Zn(2)-C6 fungal-type domain-containing protein n=1 Tax=Neoarthrinium moseri TaxID=1658444 RepID=A0A9P9WCW0_9PEZI|nr:uncharacterized protein JN550_010516 [Neoarthrinium moseri]KAI1857476.1 hypothetical protein JX265_011211 [Neoarthrinium moseri]KAI1862051.1 hypothetical protein JN550_010516 [Neoarthrinium moseri]